ncbi:hypothetical protein ACIOD1_12915 [Streptomyces sp. NPDC088097]|uniref:hypothetical protein n=1 Tax=Streptomyces sp. NPDC088097 TaxID=3365823 RepID=UPI00380111A7
MTHRTQLNQAEEHLRRSRENLPVAAQLLYAVADLLVDAQPAEPVTNRVAGLAFTYAGLAVLAQYPQAVQDAALDRALAVVPEARPSETGGEWALRLRAAAGSVR